MSDRVTAGDREDPTLRHLWSYIRRTWPLAGLISVAVLYGTFELDLDVEGFWLNWPAFAVAAFCLAQAYSHGTLAWHRLVVTHLYFQVAAISVASSFPDRTVRWSDEVVRLSFGGFISMLMALLLFVVSRLFSPDLTEPSVESQARTDRYRAILVRAATALPVTVSAFLLAIFSEDAWLAIGSVPLGAVIGIFMLCVSASVRLARSDKPTMDIFFQTLVTAVFLFTTFAVLTTCLVQPQLVADWSGQALPDNCLDGACGFLTGLGVAHLKISLLFSSLSLIAISDAASILPPRSRAAETSTAE